MAILERSEVRRSSVDDLSNAVLLATTCPPCDRVTVGEAHCCCRDLVSTAACRNFFKLAPFLLGLVLYPLIHVTGVF